MMGRLAFPGIFVRLARCDAQQKLPMSLSLLGVPVLSKELSLAYFLVVTLGEYPREFYSSSPSLEDPEQ